MKKITREIIWQTLRFVFVGALNTGVDFIVFNLLADFAIGLQSPLQYFFCKSIAFLVAMLNSFFFNSRFTFRDHERKEGIWWRFAAVTIGTFIIASAISTEAFALLVRYTTIAPIFAGNISVVVSVLIGMATNFLGYKFFVFKDHEETL